MDLTASNAYFEAKLHSTSWDNVSDGDKVKALNQALLIIDRFGYKGFKTVSSQLHEWPRTICGVSSTPNEILYAQYEIAYALLDGVDPERESRGSNVVSRGYSAVRTSYDVNRVPDHIIAGVPSAVAWSLLYPFLEKSETIRLHRVS